MRVIKSKDILEYLCCMDFSNVEALTYCGSRSDSDMLRVLFIRRSFFQVSVALKYLLDYRFAVRANSLNAQ
jgi:hypothetical protein